MKEIRFFPTGEITKGTGNILDLTDPDGVRIIQEQILLGQQAQGGYVSYVWNKLGADRPVPKVSYVRGIPEWRWIIGTGVYLDTIDRQIEQREHALFKEFQRLVIKSLLIFHTFLGFDLFLGQPLFPKNKP